MTQLLLLGRRRQKMARNTFTIPASLVRSLTAALFATVMLFGASSAALADDPEIGPDAVRDPTDVWAIARGGQLYDNWMSVILADEPEASHPAYPAEGKQKGAGTWRCKECHGWDYMGVEGAYASGSHYTGIKGVRGVAGMDPDAIHQILMDETHGMTDQHMPHAAMEMLAIFLSRGQLDTDRYIDRQSKAARGNPRRGAGMYQTICAVCHGFDGTEINFKAEPKKEYVGTVCAKNPWEALHKIRFGQPGVGMIALATLSTDELIDMLAYCQTLPTE
jgi:thiosulfate dehydrogenase